MMRVVKELRKITLITIKSSFVCVHAYPSYSINNNAGYIDKVVDEMIPQIEEEELADYIDVFCDKGFFSPVDTDTILETGIQYGLKPRIHANELDYSGGVQTGVKNGA